MKKYLLIVQDVKKHDVFVELLGNGLLGSVYYERKLSNKPVWRINANPFIT